MPALVGLLCSRSQHPITTGAAMVGFSSHNFAYLKGRCLALSVVNGAKQLPVEGDK